MDDATKKIIAAINAGPDDGEDGPLCRLCHQSMTIGERLDPTPLCNTCAQDAVETLVAAIAAKPAPPSDDATKLVDELIIRMRSHPKHDPYGIADASDVLQVAYETAATMIAEARKERDDAAAALTSLAAEREAKPTWIACSERMPSRSGIYLVIRVGDMYGMKNRRWHELDQWDGEEFHGHRFSHVTHWMPLPDASALAAASGGGEGETKL